MTNNFVDPSALSLPSPQSDAHDSSYDDSAAGPSRKRSRTEMSAEERREARAHRNRIAAQNSRDKRKAQFSTLERRVAELEEENRQLRAGMTLSDLHNADIRRTQELEREKARERENAELKERIKSLEKGWEAVMKVLSAQGLPSPASSNQQTPSSSTPSSTSSNPSPPSSTSNTTTTFPVFIPSAPVFPITPSPTGGDHRGPPPHGVPAAGGLNPTLQSAFPSPASPLPPADFAPTPLAGTSSPAPADEAAVDAWIREIFSGSPIGAPAVLPEYNPTPLGGEEPVVPYDYDTAATPAAFAAPLMASPEIVSNWENGVEMQRLLDLLPMVQSDGEASTALGLELCGGWNFERGPIPASSSGVGVF